MDKRRIKLPTDEEGTALKGIELKRNGRPKTKNGDGKVRGFKG